MITRVSRLSYQNLKRKYHILVNRKPNINLYKKSNRTSLINTSMNFIRSFFSPNPSSVKLINKNELKDMIEKKEDFFLIDVREPHEIQANGAIETSHNIPIGQIVKAFQLNHDDFEEKYGFEKPSENDTVIFYCKAGGRSASAAELVSSLGYRNVINYSGSYDDWSSK